MKKSTLLVLLTVVAVATASVAGSANDFNGLFGFKFGERMVSNVNAIPAGDGTLLAAIEPDEPEFTFDQYFLSILPKSKMIVGFSAISSFEPGNEVDCNKKYLLLKNAIEKKLMVKMKSIKPSPSGVGDSLTIVRNSVFVFKDGKTVMLQTVKDHTESYSLRFFAVDINRAKKAIQEAKKFIAENSTFKGLFGRKLGAKVPRSDEEISLASGMCIKVFEPENKFLDFNSYMLQVLPKSRKTALITAFTDMEERFSATECFTKTCQLLEKKFKLTLTDITANFNTQQPDGDGEQYIKVATMTFPGTSRMINVECLKDVDNNVFRVRISAIDLILLESLETERKGASADNADSAALDAL